MVFMGKPVVHNADVIISMRSVHVTLHDREINTSASINRRGRGKGSIGRRS